MDISKFSEIKDTKKRRLYNDLWKDNAIVKAAKIEKTKYKDGESSNSFSFVGDNKVETLINLFEIKDENQDMFRSKYNMACGGSGQEERRITTLHSSSLCALLFFYNVTETNKLTIGGIGTFTDSVFEFRSPVIDPRYPSCMDVVLLGKNEKGETLVLFLESKFSEYYASASKKYNISDEYCNNPYSAVFYKSNFLEKLDLQKSDKKNHSIDLCASEKWYIGGIKQMISHYVGIRNNLDPNCPYVKQKTKEHNKVVEALDNGAKIVLAEIIFDSVIGDFTFESGITCKDIYNTKYTVLANEMNEEIKGTKYNERFIVWPCDLGYSMFKAGDSTFVVDEKVKEYYFGK